MQAAFSHNGLSQKFDGTRDGAFRTTLSDKRVSGPVIITHSKNDKAVGVAYPLASKIAQDQSSALGDKDDPYGGMGRNGAQKTPEATGNEAFLKAFQAGGSSYSFARGKVYNLNGDQLIMGHGDITSLAVVNAFLNSVAA